MALEDTLLRTGVYGFVQKCGEGIGCFSQYTFNYILSINPALFRLFQRKHYVLFFMGTLGSAINSRAILPFLLLIALDLDYSKLDKKTKLWILLFFGLQVLILISFTRWGG